MKRARLLVAVADPSSELLIKAFWETLPETIRSHYQYISLIWKTPMELVERLEQFTASELMDTMVVMEPPSELDLPWDFEQIGREGRGICVSLVLLFPEVYFVFLGKMPSWRNVNPSFERRRLSFEVAHFVSWISILRLTELVRHHMSEFRTLFDPCGLRNFLKLSLMDVSTSERRGLQYLERVQRRLTQEAAVADEEADYSYLHGYTLYRMGYAVTLLGTEEEFRYQLEQGDRRCRYISPPSFLITDWDLAYPDHEDTRTPGRLENSYALSHLHKLVDAMSQPVLVVTGYAGDPELVAFKANTGAGQGPRQSIGKPHGGIFRIKRMVEDMCVTRKAIELRRSRKPPTYLKTWLPWLRSLWNRQRNRTSLRQKSTDSPVPGGPLQREYFRHSLPFGRAVIVESLITRSEDIKHREPLNVRESILQSLLALEAKELLGGISRTTAYEATYLQIDGELSAELSWFGIGFEAEVERRIKETEDESHQMLKMERERIALHAGRPAKTGHSADGHLPLKHSTDEQEANYLYRIFDLMRDKYNQNGQIVAGEKCHRKILKWHDKIPKQGQSWFAYCVSRYIRWATADGTDAKRILLISAAIMLGFSVCYWILLVELHSTEIGSLKKILLALGNGIFSFVGLQPGLDEYKDAVRAANPHGLWRIWNFFAELAEMLFAYLHLGLLLSVVYRKLTRAAL